MKKIVILYSGGLDSFLMFRLAKKENPTSEIICLFIDHGQESLQAELRSLPEFVIIKKIDWLNDEIKAMAKKSDPFAGAIYIPGRNLLFSTMAACLYLPTEIWMGTTFDEDNPKGTDKNSRFREDSSDLLSYVLSPFVEKVKIIFPFVERKWTKEKSVEWALQNGISEDELKSTVSCWHHDGIKPCGVCKQCVKRGIVFKLNGFKEDCYEDFETSPKAKNLIQSYIDIETDNLDELNMKNMINKMRKIS